MKILILHHVESCWAKSMLSHAGLHYEVYLERVSEHLAENDYDRVLLNRFEGIELEPEHYPIAEYINQVKEYGYGWEADMFGDETERYCEGGNHSNVVEIADWMHDLKGHDVNIAGAFDGECIEDLEVAMDHLDIKFNRVEELIV